MCSVFSKQSGKTWDLWIWRSSHFHNMGISPLLRKYLIFFRKVFEFFIWISKYNFSFFSDFKPKSTMSSSESSSYSSTEEEYEIGALYDQNGKKVHVRWKKTKCITTRVTIFESVFLFLLFYFIITNSINSMCYIYTRIP